MLEGRISDHLGAPELIELVQKTPIGVALFDRDMRYLAYNDRFADEYGLTENLLGRSHFEVFRDAKDEWRGLVAGVLRGEAHSCDVDVYPREDGTTEYLKWKVGPWRRRDGTVGGILLFVERITEQVQTEQRLREQESHMANLFEHSPIGLNLCRMDGLWLKSNQAFLDIIGYTAKEADGGLTYWQLTPDSYDEQEREQLRNLEARGAYGPYEKEFIRKDGSLVPVRLNGFLVERDGEKYIWSLIEDISERRKLEQALEKERLAALHASKLATLGEMAAGIAHELNNPLAIIHSFAQVIRSDLEHETTENLELAVATIEDAIERSTRIVTGLRRFARETGDDEKEWVSPKTLVDDALNLTQARIRNHGIDLEVRIDSESRIYCSAIDLSQVLINLLNNAFDAVKARSERWIRLQVTDASDAGVEFRITDSGLGIADEVAESIFNPFFTTKKVGSGTGLGLSISRGIVGSIGGELLLLGSAPNTTFVVKVPARRD